MSDLVEFLRARLDEDERAARQALTSPDNDRGQGVRIMDGELAIMPSAMSSGLAVYFARHDPARVLREVEAKRRIIEEHAADYGDCRVCARSTGETITVLGDAHQEALPHPCPTLRLLALPYADHPDYREEWRPT